MHVTFIIGQEQIVKHYFSQPIYSELCATIQQHYGPGKIKFHLFYNGKKTVFHDNYMLGDLFVVGILPKTPIHVELKPLFSQIKANL